MKTQMFEEPIKRMSVPFTPVNLRFPCKNHQLIDVYGRQSRWMFVTPPAKFQFDRS